MHRFGLVCDDHRVQPRSKATLEPVEFHPALHAIAERLGIEPTQVAERGEPISRRNPATQFRDAIPRPGFGTRLSGRCRGRRRDQSLADHLVSLLDQIEAGLPALTALLDEGFKVDWFCDLEAKPLGNMVSLDAILLGRLRALGGCITLDIYDSQPY